MLFSYFHIDSFLREKEIILALPLPGKIKEQELNSLHLQQLGVGLGEGQNIQNNVSQNVEHHTPKHSDP